MAGTGILACAVSLVLLSVTKPIGFRIQHPVQRLFNSAPDQLPQMIPDRLLIYLVTFSRSCVQSLLTAVASFQDFEPCLAANFLSRNGTAVLLQGSERYLRYLKMQNIK
jgi:hypothetical protein